MKKIKIFAFIAILALMASTQKELHAQKGSDGTKKIVDVVLRIVSLPDVLNTAGVNGNLHGRVSGLPFQLTYDIPYNGPGDYVIAEDIHVGWNEQFYWLSHINLSTKPTNGVTTVHMGYWLGGHSASISGCINDLPSTIIITVTASGWSTNYVPGPGLPTD